MKVFFINLLILISLLSCTDTHPNYSVNMTDKPKSEMVFDKQSWQVKKGKNYLYRDKMLNDIVYNDTVRLLKKDKILELLGEPDYYRNDSNYLHYIITQKRLLSWPLHTTVMVIKLRTNNSVEWLKVYK